MSMYGPQGGPYPGQPQDPWQDGNAPDPFGAPVDPYAGGFPPDQWGGHGASGYPGYPDRSPVPPGDIWGPPQAPSRRGASGLTLAITALLALLVIGGGGTALYLVSRDKGTNVTDGPSTGPSGNPSAGPSGSSSPSADPSASQQDPQGDARVAKPGDCLVNRGSEKAPDMRKVTCATNTYQVVRRFDGTADKTKCESVPNMTDWYFFDNEVDNSQDFVLCLRKK